MDDDWWAIGEMARASGLTVSALRWYDGAGVLVPAAVDPWSGYRRYRAGQLPAARLVAALRRVRLPVADIAVAVAAVAEPGDRLARAAARDALDRHLRDLEDGLVLARRELVRAHALLDPSEREIVMSQLTVPATAFAAAVDRVRFAAATAAGDHPALVGVQLEADAGRVRLVATDRYRLAVTGLPTGAFTGEPVERLLPVGFLDELRPLLGGGDLVLDLSVGTVVATAGPHTVAGRVLTDEFPAYRRVLPAAAARPIPVDGAAVARAVAAADRRRVERDGTSHEVVVLGVDRSGALAVAGEVATEIGFDPEFLLQALSAVGADQLLLDLDGPLSPLAIRLPDDAETLSLLMPVRLI